ncbi:putative very-long-chain 3-oxoacyl-CoA synthase, Butyrate--CoA ligase [Lupinus albus]|uniref:Putative very-long-chain 3-oxoacyl-CoA synthase, Butyrate--CoA ligase n=1 Tax=Lupinus albus TaxID=3870 RepID=A0A6A4NHI5_LUPAL|nr:putative very-long-chain 3-oxoacyl-CoA synthase, Butyrate--CoA ligase [Lupinus albus]
MGYTTIENMKYWLLEHPSIKSFRWSPTQSWGSTWSFLIAAISTYITAAIILHIFLKLCRRHRPVPLGPIPALHSLAVSLISVIIFTGMVFSADAEVRDTRWLWQRTRTTSFEWFLCFPLGIRPSGRVFFWSYVFYLSRFLHFLRTFFIVLRHRELSFFRLFNHSILLIMSFLWLEFSQSFQVLAILFSTLIYTMVYGYRFWVEMGLPTYKSFSFTVNCQIVLLVLNLVCHVGVLLLHYLRGGCNGIGAWVFNSVLNVAILLHFLKSYVEMNWLREKPSTHHRHNSSLK